MTRQETVFGVVSALVLGAVVGCYRRNRERLREYVTRERRRLA